MYTPRKFGASPARVSALLMAAAVPAVASDLDLSVESGSSNAITVAPGATVNYEVLGTLTDDLNEGLAMFCFDLAFSGGALAQADAPVSANMLNFTNPLGISNPAGFGGTPIDGRLVQVGGAQNTFNINLFTAFPSGNLITGIAATTATETLATGTLTAPDKPGTYVLSVSNVKANAVRQGEAGIPWAVDQVRGGALTNLTITVESLSADIDMMSLGAGGTQTMSQDAGVANNGRFYIVLGSLTGTTPGLNLGGGVELPLIIDPYFSLTLTNPNQPPLGNSFGNLDALGQATTTFTLPAGSNPNLAGFTFSHASLLLSPIDCASNPVSLLMLP